MYKDQLTIEMPKRSALDREDFMVNECNYQAIQFIDTFQVNENIYEGVAVDSTSNYPLEKETLTEYRKRLKKQLYSSSSEEKNYPLYVELCKLYNTQKNRQIKGDMTRG